MYFYNAHRAVSTLARLVSSSLSRDQGTSPLVTARIESESCSATLAGDFLSERKVAAGVFARLPAVTLKLLFNYRITRTVA